MPSVERVARGGPEAARVLGGVGRQAAAAALLAGAIAAIFVWLGPPGRDLAAHAYQLNVFVDHGFALWDNFWYAGRYSFVTYSLVYYPLAAVFGIKLLAVVSVAAARRSVRARRGAGVGRERAPADARVRARLAEHRLLCCLPVRARRRVGTLALAALQRPWLVVRGARGPHAGREPARVPAARRGACRSSCGTSVAARPQPCCRQLALAAIVLVELILHRLFPSSWHFPFPAGEFAVLCLFCVFGAVLDGGRAARGSCTRCSSSTCSRPRSSSSSRRGSARTSRAYASRRSR